MSQLLITVLVVVETNKKLKVKYVTKISDQGNVQSGKHISGEMSGEVSVGEVCGRGIVLGKTISRETVQLGSCPLTRYY